MEQQIQTAETELNGLESTAEQVRQEYAQLISWASLYDNCTFEEFQNLYLEGETEESKKPGTEMFLAFA